MSGKMPLYWPNNKDGNPIGAIDYIMALIDEKKELEEKNEKLAEKCAVLAWNHFMEVCNRKRVSPSGNEDWCATQHIRDNWRK